MNQHRTVFLAFAISLTFLVIATATSPTWLTRRAAAATPAPAVTTASEIRSVRVQTKFFSEAIAQSQSVPILTRQNAPDIPQCRTIVNQDILDLVNAASEDPAEVFERNRRAHPHMIMMPPPLECASKLWVAARNGNGAQESGISPDLLSLRQSPIESFFNLSTLNASVGTNVDLANGVEGYQGTGSISIDPNNSLHLTAASNTFYKDPTATCQSPTGGTANTYGTIALFGSTDGGATWTYNCAPWPTTVTGGVTGATFWFGSYPTLAWDNQGRAYATYLLLSQSASAYGAAIVVARSSDNGASWQSLGTVVNGIASTTQGNDKEMMAIDNSSGQTFSHSGRLYVIWQAANAEKIAFSDNGTAWTTVNFPSNTGAGGGNVVVGADGTVYVIWSRYNVETIVFSKSTDGGATWTAPQVIATLALQSYGTNNKPPAQDKRGINGFGAIDVDRNPNSAYFGNLYVSFTDFPSGTTAGADTNAYVIRSTNGGASWSSRVKVNDDNFGATQMFPWLAVDQSDGTVNASWYDTRLDPLNRQTQMVSSRSVDGGASFEPNVLVSDGGSAWRNNVNYSDENSADNPTFNSNQYGDYSGLAALNRQVHPLWTDSRMFFPVADTQSPTRREDNATSVLTYCSAPAAIAVPVVNSSTTPSVAVSWSAPAGWGTNATDGTYSVFRDTSSVFPGGSPLASDLTSTTYIDTTGASGTTYYYFIRAKNNCPGTALTPMITDSPASAAVVFGSTGTPSGTLQGTVMAGSSAVSGVVVSAGPLSATTNASGFYLFSAISAATYTVSTSPSGYNPVSISEVVVTDGGTTVQNLSLTTITSGSCVTDTTFADFSPGSGSNVDIASSPGNVKLRNLGVQASDQVSSPAALSTTNNLSATTWTGQTFRAGVTGNLTRMDIGLGLASGSSGTITVEIRNLNGINPGTTVLATTTIGPVTNVGTAVLYTTTFATPAAVVSGTSYSVVLRTSVGSTVFGVRGSTAGGSTLANGQVFTSTNSGGTWTPVAADLYFTSYVTPPLTYTASGSLFSAAKDSNPVVGLVPRWLTLSWNATTPANTAVQFQVAASNNVNGPFNFVGPDDTSTTFFTTSGASLSQFNGFRYLKYAALLSTTDNVVSPTLNDVTVCFDNDTPLITAAAPFPRQQGAAGSAQIATVSDPGQAANTLVVTATPLAGTGVTIDTINVDVAGNVTANVAAICAATNSTFTLTVTNSASATATATLTINVTAIDTPTITPGGPTTFCEGASVTLTSSAASDNQWYLNGNPIGGATNQTYVASASGDYTVVVTEFGCSSASSTATSVSVNPIPATPTITPSVETTLCPAGDVTLTSSSTSGNQWFIDGNPIGGATSQTYIATAGGNYSVIVSSNGCSSVASAATTVTLNVAPTLTYSTPQSVAFDGMLDVTPTSASSAGYVVQSVVPALTTAPTVNSSGVVSLTNSQPTGSYTITIRATDGCAVSTDASFTLNVTLTATYADPSGTCGGNAPCFTTIQAAIDALTGPGTVNVSAGIYDENLNVSANATVNINGDTTINSLTLSGGTLNGSNGGSLTLTLAAGNWTNDGGTFNRGTGTVSFTGIAQNIGGTNSTTFNNLMVGAAGTTVAVDQTVIGVLTLTGDLTVVSPAKLIMLASASATGTGDVIGNLERVGFVTASCASAPCMNTLSVGNPNNQITITSGVAPTSVLVNLAKSAPATYGAAVQRNYTITETGGSDITATLRLHYLDSELNGNLPETNLNLRRFNGSSWPAVIRSLPVDTTDNWVESNAVTGFSQWTFASLAPTATSGSISGQILSDSGDPVAGAVVHLIGTQNRMTITDAIGNYSFGDVETGGFYSLAPSMRGYHFSPEVRSFSQLGNNTNAAFTAIREAIVFGNAIDTPEYFVRQHYLDFLGREPDEAGLNFWSNQILSCGSDTACVERRVINVSAAYFLSIEFQQTGGLVDGLYRASYGRRPQYAEFMPDMATMRRGVVVGVLDWAERLTSNQQEFLAAWVQRAQFQSTYGALTNEAYVNTLISHTNVTFSPSEYDRLVSGLNQGTSTRVDVLRQIAGNDDFVRAKRNGAFVMMQYFGYLRRDPDESGYEFWRNKLSEFNGDFERAEMVKAFLVSGEYRERFRLTP